MHPFLLSIYASARRHIAEARTHEHYALAYARQQYLGGHVGRTARRLFKDRDTKRTTSIRLAMECRSKAKRLRAELARLTAADTIQVHA